MLGRRNQGLSTGFKFIAVSGDVHVDRSRGCRREAPSGPAEAATLAETATFVDRAVPPSIVTGRSFGRFGNRVASMATTLAMAALAGPARELRHELGLPRRRTREILAGEPDTRRWPVFHGFSPAIVPRPADWPNGYAVTGYWWPQRPGGWRAPAELQKFLASGPPPVFFGFGDMTADDTSGFIELATDAGREAGVRQVIQAGQTGHYPTRPIVTSRFDRHR